MLCYRQDTFLERVSVHSSEAERAACRKARIVSWSAKTLIAPTAMNLYSGRSCCGLFQQTLRYVAQLLFPRSTCVVEQPVPSLRASLPYQPVGVCRRLHQLRMMRSDVEACWKPPKAGGACQKCPGTRSVWYGAFARKMKNLAFYMKQGFFCRWQM